MARSLVDAAADAPSDEAARALVIEAVHARQVRVDDVAHWIESRRSNGRLRLRQALAEATAGSWSAPEADLARLVRGSKVLPDPWQNPKVVDEQGRGLTTPDLWLDDVGMALMVHSRQFHGGELDWAATVGNDTDLQVAGAIVMGFAPSRISAQPRHVLAEIERAYVVAAKRGARVRPTATPRLTVRWSA